MQAVLLMDERRVLAEHCFVEMTSGACHAHWLGAITATNTGRPASWMKPACCVIPYTFTTLDQLVDDFLGDVARL